MADMPLSEVIKTSLENIKNVLDANTVIGEPITVLEDTAIVPISKISVGFASAGAEYNGKKELKNKNFGGGGGTGLSISPVGFLVVGADGSVDMINVGMEAQSGAIEQVAGVIERSPEIIAKIRSVFSKDKDDDK